MEVNYMHVNVKVALKYINSDDPHEILHIIHRSYV